MPAEFSWKYFKPGLSGRLMSAETLSRGEVVYVMPEKGVLLFVNGELRLEPPAFVGIVGDTEHYFRTLERINPLTYAAVQDGDGYLHQVPAEPAFTAHWLADAYYALGWSFFGDAVEVEERI